MRIKSQVWFFALVLVMCVFPFIQAQDKTGEELYQEALFLMEGMGNYAEAIKIFGEIARDFPDNEQLAARALLQMGLCYENLGMLKAQKVFQEIVEKYPEQTREVNLAKERLARIAKALEEQTPKPDFQKIRIPAAPRNGVLSPDGKLLAFVSQGSVWAVPISGRVQPDLAGEPVRLTEPMGAFNVGNIMAWSGDSQWIAFNAIVRGLEVDKYVVSVSGGEPMKVPLTSYRGGGAYNYRLSLSSDGSTLAFCSMDITSSDIHTESNRPLLLYTIPVEGGEARRLTDTPAGQPVFSPDDKRIAFIRRYIIEEVAAQNELWVINADGTEPVKLIDFIDKAMGPAVMGPVWSPDGTMIAFHYLSDEIWIIPASKDHKTEVEPIKIKLPLSSTQRIISGWTTDNKMGLILEDPRQRHQAAYTVPATGGRATQISPEITSADGELFEGLPFHPRWSSDGKKIYFRWGKGNIASIPSEGGKPSIVHSSKDTKIVTGIPGGGNDVSPDGKTVVFMAYIEGVYPIPVDIWTVPAEGGEPTQITNSPSQDRYPCWSPDGKSIAFVRSTEKSKDEYIANINIIPAEGGEIRQLTTEADRVSFSSIKWSPDGETIAYFSLDTTINIKPLQGEEPSVVVNIGDTNLGGHSELSWSPDGKELAFTSRGRIMVVSLEGGEMREVEIDILNEDVQSFHIDWSPDGEKFTFTAGFRSGGEFWLMENFLPVINN